MRQRLLLAVVAVLATGCKQQERTSEPPLAPVVTRDAAPATSDEPAAPDRSAKVVERAQDTPTTADKPSKAAGTPAPANEDELPPSLYAPPAEPPSPPIPTKTPPMSNDRSPPREPTSHAPPPSEPPDAPRPLRLAAVKQLCVTTGAAAIGKPVDKPAMRAVARTTDGEAAELTFTFRGDTKEHKRLASGQVRKQLGLKLRAENGCNLIYVMWRLDPKPRIEVQVKRNPGAKDHEACGANGYTKVKGAESKPLPDFTAGTTYALRAEIRGDELAAYVDDKRVWRGTLPASARELRGPAGIRSDNLAFDLIAFSAPAASGSIGNAKCLPEDRD